MKNLLLTFVFALITANSFAQSTDGRDEFNQALFATSQKNYKKADKYFEKSYKKGFIPTNTEILHNQWSWMISPFRRLEGLKKCAENGDSECMFVYGAENIDKSQDIANNISLKQFATSSTQEAYDYLIKSAKAGYEPAYLYLGEKATKAGDTVNAIKIYQVAANKGNKIAQYQVALLKKDPRQAFDLAKQEGHTAVHAMYNAVNASNDAKFVLETAKVYNEQKENSSASFLYDRACELGSGEGCYRRGLDYLSDYRGHENGLKRFDKAIALGYKVPETEYLKMKNSPSAEDVKQVDEKLQREIEQSVKWAKNHPNEDEPAVKENIANNKTKTGLTQSDMDKIIKENSSTKSQQSEAERHRIEMEKQARDAEKIKNGTWNGH